MNLEIVIALGMLLCNMILTGIAILRACHAVTEIRKAQEMIRQLSEGNNAGEA